MKELFKFLGRDAVSYGAALLTVWQLAWRTNWRISSCVAWQLLNQSLGPSANWDSGDFENVDGGYPSAGEHYGVAGTPMPARSIEGWYPGHSQAARAAQICYAHAHTRFLANLEALYGVRKSGDCLHTAPD